MANETTISPTTEAKDTDIPFWMIVIWCVAGVLVVIMIIVAIYYSYVVCCQRRKRKRKRPFEQHRNPRHPMDFYPRGYIQQLHSEDANARSMFSPSFVDNMRIPRAMEVKIIESVNSLNNTHPRPLYSPTCQSPTRLSQDYLNADMFSLPNKERMPPTRQQSFRYSNMSTEESNERMFREKMLVSELREKLRNQQKINE
ncbi:uncharacterized protein LOC144662632 [Oculina patagonica]